MSAAKTKINSNDSTNIDSTGKDKVDNLNQFKFLGKLGENLTSFFQTNKPKGYAIIVLVIMFFYVGVLLVKPILVVTARQFRDTNIFYAKRLADRTGLATTSPIRNYITDQVHRRTQQQLIDHLALNRSNQDSYSCQGQTVPTLQRGGDLKNQFGICDPAAILAGLDGDTNQTVDFLSYIYPKHNIPLEDKYLESMRKSLIEQYTNTYDYTLRTIYVGQERLFDTASQVQINRYRYMVRADMETHTYFNITNQMVAYFDVVIDDQYYPLPFDGAGSNCDQLAQPPVDIPVPNLIITQPDGTTMICGEGIDCQPLGVTVLEGDPPTEKFYPYGSPQYAEACGTDSSGKADPYCGQGGPGGINGNSNCGTTQGTDLNCDLGNGFTYHGYAKPFNIRPKRGCASINTKRNARSREIDPDGYTFIVTTRLVSFGSTFN